MNLFVSFISNSGAFSNFYCEIRARSRAVLSKNKVSSSSLFGQVGVSRDISGKVGIFREKSRKTIVSRGGSILAKRKFVNVGISRDIEKSRDF